LPFLATEAGGDPPFWVEKIQTEIVERLPPICRIYTLEGTPSTGLVLARGVLYDGVRIVLGDDLVDIKSGMKPSGEFGRFVMGVFVPTQTAEEDPFFKGEGGLYPIYANSVAGEIECEFGLDLLKLTAMERRALITLKWEWMTSNATKRQACVAFVTFRKDELKIVPREEGRVDDGGRNMDNMGRRNGVDGRASKAGKVLPRAAVANPGLSAEVRAVKKGTALSVGKGKHRRCGIVSQRAKSAVTICINGKEEKVDLSSVTWAVTKVTPKGKGKRKRGESEDEDEDEDDEDDEDDEEDDDLEASLEKQIKRLQALKRKLLKVRAEEHQAEREFTGGKGGWEDSASYVTPTGSTALVPRYSHSDQGGKGHGQSGKGGEWGGKGGEWGGKGGDWGGKGSDWGGKGGEWGGKGGGWCWGSGGGSSWGQDSGWGSSSSSSWGGKGGWEDGWVPPSFGKGGKGSCGWDSSGWDGSGKGGHRSLDLSDRSSAATSSSEWPRYKGSY
jgi:hypothetical protein